MINFSQVYVLIIHSNAVDSFIPIIKSGNASEYEDAPFTLQPHKIFTLKCQTKNSDGAHKQEIATRRVPMICSCSIKKFLPQVSVELRLDNIGRHVEDKITVRSKRHSHDRISLMQTQEITEEFMPATWVTKLLQLGA